MDDYKTVKAETEFLTHREHHSPRANGPLRLPKANLNEAKLRHILNELKRT